MFKDSKHQQINEKLRRWKEDVSAYDKQATIQFVLKRYPAAGCWGWQKDQLVRLQHGLSEASMDVLCSYWHFKEGGDDNGDDGKGDDGDGDAGPGPDSGKVSKNEKARSPSHLC